MGVERLDQIVDPGRRRDRGDGHHAGVARADRAQRGVQVAPRAGGDLAEVGLRHDEHVRDLHDPRLQELQRVARARLDDDRDGVGGVGDVGLGLPTPTVSMTTTSKAWASACAAARVAGARPPSRSPAAIERMKTRAVARVGLDARAVAEQRAAGALRGRVDGEHGDGAPALPPRLRQRAQQRRLAGAGRAGDTDDGAGVRARAPPAAPPLRPLRAVLDQVQDRRGDGRVPSRSRAARSSALTRANASPGGNQGTVPSFPPPGIRGRPLPPLGIRGLSPRSHPASGAARRARARG